MIAESPTSPRKRDSIHVAPILADTVARLHAEADRTGRNIGDIAADWLDTYQPPARRVVAVVDCVDVDDEDGVTRRVWRTHGPIAGDWDRPMLALEYADCTYGKGAWWPAGPTRYELIEETP